ncbi:MAG: carbonic anhydrase [Clostridiales bacterium]|nr:carbonic anhydrase [Clostridiales bacterium]
MRKKYHDILTFGTETVLGEHSAICEPAAFVLDCLVSGNQDYQTTEENPAELSSQRRAHTTEQGQRPCAVLICCADSRVPAEHIFHAGIGELFVIRNAGNVIGHFCLGSVEYAVEHLNAPLVIVMGHTNCGAVGAALKHEIWKGGLAKIIEEVEAAIGDEVDPRKAERKNLLHSLKRLGESEILRELHKEGRVEFAAAIYDIKSGNVEFLANA